MKLDPRHVNNSAEIIQSMFSKFFPLFDSNATIKRDLVLGKSII